MELDPGLFRVVAYFGMFAVMLFCEWRGPFVVSDQRKAARVAFHLGLSIGNTVLLYLLLAPVTGFVLARAEGHGFGLTGLLGLSGGAEIVATLVALDFWDYWMHLVNHKIRFLWRFHRAHHSDMEMDVTTGSRFHVGELVISGLVKALAIVVWGPSLWGLIAFDTVLTTASQFHHGNVNIPFGLQDWLEKIVVTPRMHRAHHALHRDCFNTNFATIFSVWDRIFRSYHWSRDRQELDGVGLYKPRGPETMRLGPLLMTPVRI